MKRMMKLINKINKYIYIGLYYTYINKYFLLISYFKNQIKYYYF